MDLSQGHYNAGITARLMSWPRLANVWRDARDASFHAGWDHQDKHMAGARQHGQIMIKSEFLFDPSKHNTKGKKHYFAIAARADD